MTTINDLYKTPLKQSQNVAGKSVFCHSAFTGKELDSETGFSYFGARYLDHTLLTSWFTVDPMSDKYPSLSPYNYCAWNPVKLVDPDGRIIKGVKYNAETGQFSFSWLAKKHGVDKYINARCKTASGRESIMRMINSNRKFTIEVTDKPIVISSHDDPQKVCQLGGIVHGNDYILISTADRTRSKCTAIYVDEEHVLEWSHLVLEKDWASSTGDKNYENAYQSTGMEEFEKKHPYQSEEQRIHGTGAHEETHALDNGSEEQAFFNEKKERLEYIEENQYEK